jgi:hypothetical protein
VSVTANGPEARYAEIVLSSSGKSVTVTVTQAAGNAEVEVEKGEFYPDPTSGIELDPVCPDADKPCTIKFNPASDNPLYGHTGELYAHLGVVVDGEWKFVPSDWGTTDEKVHFKKVADNSWELKLEPTVREYFQSGETPVTKLAIIVRTADGSIKSHDADQFCSATDNKYKAEEFVPDDLVTKKLPEGVEHGINYNADGSVTFVLYDKDKDGNPKFNDKGEPIMRQKIEMVEVAGGDSKATFSLLKAKWWFAENFPGEVENVPEKKEKEATAGDLFANW